ncbi:MAG: ATP-binding cassette domain-containing protein [Candidatus Scalindua sp. AMX11]|nr:MAG: ATP-binding cassette domain-containing protein [Candidatus Scalindua sp.]NOG86160.1 ATP-binding cassette domain-containing protein [Planctomycetota bacterium]RZV98919.1 MAG: ATP-binding cassette domain-containing protein [Candidatus Scalindua sp. SCAELEC01]TDE66889.1 MAG: ATP-binding cassette domain-containing protein [Candidatus Scalindua sp. AMX11]GJQ57692.1 MAG: daunorubicin ABC transporter ATP-binding protein [Candidatus Scalindua sp.]
MREEKVAIEASDLRKEFSVDESGKGFLGKIRALFHRRRREIVAVDGINFQIKPGEFVGYVGENGAGKSTTIKMLTGILVPSSGSAVVNGIVPYENRKKNAARIGVVFGQRTQLWWDLPVRESFEMLRVIFRVTKPNFLYQMERLERALDLKPLLKMPVRKLSLGQRMRCDMAAALIHNPPVLFLDEPTIGLDVLVKDAIRKFLLEINREEGTTIILTTHDMNDIEQMCKRLIILDEGNIIFDGDTESLKQQFVHEKVIEVEFHQDEVTVKGLPGVTVINEEGCKKWLKFDNENTSVGEVVSLLATNYKVKDLSVREPSVESIIKNIYSDSVVLPTPIEKIALPVD